MVYIAVNENLDMLITEPDGKKVGKNSLINRIYGENDKSVYATPEGISLNGDAIPDFELTSSYDNTNAMAGDYTVEIFNRKPVPTSYSMIRNSFDLNGNVNEMSKDVGTIQPGSSVVYKINHSTEIYTEENASMQIYQAKYFDAVRNDKAFVKGRLVPINKSNIIIAKDVQITIGNQVKTIPIRKFQSKRFNKRHIVYTYANWGRKGVVFQINTKTGDFLLYFDNIDLDDSKPSLNVDLKIMLDSLVAKSEVTFKNIIKRKHGK